MCVCNFRISIFSVRRGGNFLVLGPIPLLHGCVNHYLGLSLQLEEYLGPSLQTRLLPSPLYIIHGHVMLFLGPSLQISILLSILQINYGRYGCTTLYLGSSLQLGIRPSLFYTVLGGIRLQITFFRVTPKFFKTTATATAPIRFTATEV